MSFYIFCLCLLAAHFRLSSVIHGLTAMVSSMIFKRFRKHHLLFWSLEISQPSYGQNLIYLSSYLLYCFLQYGWWRQRRLQRRQRGGPAGAPLEYYDDFSDLDDVRATITTVLQDDDDGADYGLAPPSMAGASNGDGANVRGGNGSQRLKW